MNIISAFAEDSGGRMLRAKFVTKLDDWEDVKFLSQKLIEEGWAKRVGYTFEQLEGYTTKVFQNPIVYGIVLVYDDNYPVGIAFLQQLIGEKDFQVQPRTFIMAAYMVNNAPLEASKLGWKMINLWTLARKHDIIMANVRYEAAFKALERRYGLKKAHVLITADVKDMLSDSDKESFQETGCLIWETAAAE